MQFHYGVLLVVFVFTFQCHFLDVLSKIPSTLLEESVKLKLRTAVSLRNNVGKFFNQLQSSNWEIHHSLQQIQKFLRNGGSLIECLYILPTLSYMPVDKQFNGILTAMEAHLPKHLLPAISTIRNAINDSSNLINIEEILQPNGGALQVDIFEGIAVQDLPKLVLPTPFSEDVAQHVAHGLCPSFIEKVILSISKGSLNYTSPLMGLILENLINFSSSPQQMEIIKHFTLKFTDNYKEVINLNRATDPYKLVQNILSTIDKRSPIKVSAESILSCLNKKLKMKESVPEIASFFIGERMNHSNLISNNKQLIKTKSAKILLELIQSDYNFLNNALHDFQPYEYPTPEDLQMAVISKLRRYQAHKGTISEVVENVYENLIRLSHLAVWKQIPKSAGAMKALLYTMKNDPNSQKIRRLAGDISASIEINVNPETWLKTPNYIPNVNCYGPSCTVLQTLESIQYLDAIKDQALNVSISELIKTHKQYYSDNIFDSCRSSLANDPFKNLKQGGTVTKTLYLNDLMQAIPELDIESKEYIPVKEILSSEDLEKQIGESIDVKAHPTRGRLLAWLLGKIESLTNVEEQIRKAAARFIDNISYDGYGAVPVLLRLT